VTDFDTASLVLPVPEHWPVPPKKPAFHGLAGDLAMAAEPYTEADPVAILVQFLVAFGNVVGRGPHRMIGATPHRSNEFAVCSVMTTTTNVNRSQTRAARVEGSPAHRDWITLRHSRRGGQPASDFRI
jgi:hypothetical protein